MIEQGGRSGLGGGRDSKGRNSIGAANGGSSGGGGGSPFSNGNLYESNLSLDKNLGQAGTGQNQQQQLQPASISISKQLMLRESSRQSLQQSQQSSSSSSSSPSNEWVGTIEVENINRKLQVMYKLRSNRPKNYRLSQSCGILDPGSSVSIEVRLVDIDSYSVHDLFQANTIALTEIVQESLQAHNLLTPEPSISSDWQYLLDDKERYQIHSSIVQVVLASQSRTNEEQQLQQQEAGTPTRSSIRQLSNSNGSSILKNSNGFTRSSANKTYQIALNSELISDSHRTATGVNANGNRVDQSNSILGKSTPVSPQSTYNANSYFKRQMKSSQFGGAASNQQQNQQWNSSLNGSYRGGSWITSQVNFKELYEKLVVKVEESDKVMFVLNLEKKKLESEWLSKSQQHETNKTELQNASKKTNNTIQLQSAVLIAFISLLLGIYLGN